MPVADPQQVGYDTVSGAAFHVVAHHVGAYSVGAVLAGVVLHEKVLNGFVFSEDLCHVRTINKLEWWNGRIQIKFTFNNSAKNETLVTETAYIL